MKIHLHIEPDHEELEVHIYAPSFSEKVEQMMQLLKTERNETIPGYVEQHIHFIKIEDIYSIYELAENTRDFSHEMNRLRTRCVF